MAQELVMPSIGVTTDVVGLRVRLEGVASAVLDCRQVVLVVVAHPDDEALGPGATLSTLSALPATAVFLMVAAAGDTVRRQEFQRAAAVLGIPSEHVFLFDFPYRALAHYDVALRNILRLFADVVQPDIVITHAADVHPDHTALCMLARHVFARNGVTLLHFRIPYPLWSPWNPAVWFRVPEDAAELKLGELFAAYPSQYGKDFFDAVKARGILVEGGHSAGSRFAEGFQVSRVTLEPCPCGCGAIALARHPARSERGPECHSPVNSST